MAWGLRQGRDGMQDTRNGGGEGAGFIPKIGFKAEYWNRDVILNR